MEPQINLQPVEKHFSKTKLATIIILLGIVPALSFYIGKSFQATTDILETEQVVSDSISPEIESQKAVIRQNNIDPTWTRYENKDVGFSFAYPSNEWQSNPFETGTHFTAVSPSADPYLKIKMSYLVSNVSCSRISGYKSPDEEQLETAGGVTLKHTYNESVTKPNSKLSSREVRDKYFYDTGTKCHTLQFSHVTTVSNIDRNDPTGTKELSKEELEMKWKDLDQTISSYKEKAIEIFKTYTIL